MWKPYESPQVKVLGSIGAVAPAAPGIYFAKPGFFFDFPGGSEGNTNKPPLAPLASLVTARAPVKASPAIVAKNNFLID